MWDGERVSDRSRNLTCPFFQSLLDGICKAEADGQHGRGQRRKRFIGRERAVFNIVVP